MKLHIGCGPWPIHGWTNVDLNPLDPSVNFLDASLPFPWPDQSFSHIFSEHLIEHLAYDGALNMLKESFRCLKTGGRIRIATPDIKFLAELLRPDRREVCNRYIAWANSQFIGHTTPTAEAVVNNFFRAWGHQFIWSGPLLEKTLKDVGFSKIVWCVPGLSGDPHFINIERHGRSIPAEFNVLETMVVEAVRP